MHETDLELIKGYLKYRIIGMAESLLDDKTYEIAFDFYKFNGRIMLKGATSYE